MRLWSVARYDLRLSNEDFYGLTPRQLDALIKRRERETQDREFLFAQLTAYTINFSMARPKAPVKISDLMPSEWAKARPPKIKRRRRAVVADELRLVMGHFMRTNNG